jgi:hypothetical protein
MAVGVAASSTLNSRAQERIGSLNTTIASLLFLLAGVTGLATVGVDGAITTVALLGIPLGIGFGLLAPPLVGVVAGRFPGSAQPGAIGIFYLCFFLGGALGGAFSTGLVQRQASLPGFDAGLPTAEAVFAIVVVAALVVARRATSLREQGRVRIKD